MCSVQRVAQQGQDPSRATHGGTQQLRDAGGEGRGGLASLAHTGTTLTPPLPCSSCLALSRALPTPTGQYDHSQGRPAHHLREPLQGSVPPGPRRTRSRDRPHRFLTPTRAPTEGVLVAKKDFNAPKHQELDVKNLFVIKACQSLTSRGYLTTHFSWQYYYVRLSLSRAHPVRRSR